MRRSTVRFRQAAPGKAQVIGLGFSFSRTDSDAGASRIDPVARPTAALAGAAHRSASDVRSKCRAICFPEASYTRARHLRLGRSSTLMISPPASPARNAHRPGCTADDGPPVTHADQFGDTATGTARRPGYRGTGRHPRPVQSGSIVRVLTRFPPLIRALPRHSSVVGARTLPGCGELAAALEGLRQRWALLHGAVRDVAEDPDHEDQVGRNRIDVRSRPARVCQLDDEVREAGLIGGGLSDGHVARVVLKEGPVYPRLVRGAGRRGHRDGGRRRCAGAYLCDSRARTVWWDGRVRHRGSFGVSGLTRRAWPGEDGLVMTTTLDDLTLRRKEPEASAEAAAAAELVRLAREQGLSLTGPDGLLIS